MENHNLVQSSNSTGIQAFEPMQPIREQKESEWQIAASLVAKWIELERVVVKAQDIQGREQSTEEVSLMMSMMRKYATLTPRQIGDAMRNAAKDCQSDFANNRRLFPKMYLEDIEHSVQKMVLEILKNKPEPLELPQNTGGNAFFGEPIEAIHREWPNIAKHTLLMRKNTAMASNWRYRFWHTSNADEKAAAMQMIAEMVEILKNRPDWDESKMRDRELKIFKVEYYEAFPDWPNVVDGMLSTRNPDEINRIRTETQTKITRQLRAGSTNIPPITAIPSIHECARCAVFDAYFEHWKEFEIEETHEN